MHVTADSSPARTSPTDGGFVMLTVVILTLMLGGLSAAFLSESVAEKASIELRGSRIKGLQICEKGVVQSMLEIHALKDAGTDGMGNVSGVFSDGTYEATATRNPTSPDRWIVRARAEYHNTVRRVEVGVRRRSGGGFVEGLFAKDALRFNGTTFTDAYDSRLGSYASQAVNVDADGPYALEGGHIGSNSDLFLTGTSVTIRGNAIPGPAHSVQVSGDPTVWGDVFPRRVAIDLDPMPQSDFEAALATNDNDQLLPAGPGGAAGGGAGGHSLYDPRRLSLTGHDSGDVVLDGGVYFFSEVRLTGLTKLVINGPTKIYVTGEFNIGGGGFVNMSGIPSDFQLISHPYAVGGADAPLSSRITIQGGSKAAAAIFAPGSPIVVQGSGDIFGALVGDTIDVAGDSNFHYDKALGDVITTNKIVVERLYWRDLDERVRH